MPETENKTSGAREYAAAWADLRRRHWINCILWLGYLPVGVLVLIAHAWLHRNFGFGWLFPAIMLPWFFSIPAASAYLFFFRCPRCNRLFYYSFKLGTWLWKKNCVHCGLKVGVLHDPGISEEFLRQKARAEKLTRRFSLVFGIVSVSILVAIAVLTSVMAQRLKPAQLVTEQFLQRIQKDDFSGAHASISDDGKQRVTIQRLQTQWQQFETEYGDLEGWEYSGSHNLPTTMVSMTYRLKTESNKIPILRVNLQKLAEEWRIESFAFQTEISTAPPKSIGR